jgi:hypothetical protein
VTISGPYAGVPLGVDPGTPAFRAKLRAVLDEHTDPAEGTSSICQ